MAVEILTSNPEFEQNVGLETEKQYIPHNSALFEKLRPYADRITQPYLSSPHEPYSLRLRKRESLNGDITYTATLKDRGRIVPNGLLRTETQTPISPETFEYYSAGNHISLLTKLRADICPGVSIDWVEGKTDPIIEIENIGSHPEAAEFLRQMQSHLVEHTGELDVDSESLAYELSGISPEAVPTLSVEEIIREIKAYQSAGYRQLVVGIGGRSGSGKSTLARELAKTLYLKEHTPSLRLSTDDYHVGKHYLEATHGAPWTNWDSPEVYDTKALQRDIQLLRSRKSVPKRYFDFASQEPSIEGTITCPPGTVIIVEGIFAGSKDLQSTRNMFYEVPTPLATSLGRDITRLIKSGRAHEGMRLPEERLRYMVEVGEPAYRKIDRARNIFSGCVRPLGGAALHKENI